MVEGDITAVGPAVRVGTSGWSYPSWVGSFYPERTSAARMLPFYAGTFGAVEAHNTHRRFPLESGLAKWTTQTPPDFRFVPKAHVGITHRRDTDGLDQRVAAFYAALSRLGERLGPVIHVLPHHQPDFERLDALLSALAGLRGPNAVDGRHPVFELAPGWWTDAVFERFAAAEASIALVDREDGPAPPSDLPFGPVAYVRLRRPTYSEDDLDRWAGRLVDASRGGRPVYAFVKHDEGGDGPRYARGLVNRLSKA